MFGDKPPEVLIAGAGPVGLFTALALARRGVTVRIVDTGVWACTHSYALAPQPQTLPLFEDLGLYDRVMHNCYRVNSIVLADAGGPRARIALNAGDPKLCLAVLRQDVLESLLERALGEHGIQVDWRREVARLRHRPYRMGGGRLVDDRSAVRGRRGRLQLARAAGLGLRLPRDRPGAVLRRV